MLTDIVPHLPKNGQPLRVSSNGFGRVRKADMANLTPGLFSSKKY